jgi:hypothetical protein
MLARCTTKPGFGRRRGTELRVHGPPTYARTETILIEPTRETPTSPSRTMVPHATLPCTLMMHHRQTLGEPDVDDTRLPCWELSRALIMSDGSPMDNPVHTCAYSESTNRVLILLHRRELTFDGGSDRSCPLRSKLLGPALGRHPRHRTSTSITPCQNKSMAWTFSGSPIVQENFLGRGNTAKYSVIKKGSLLFATMQSDCTERLPPW